MKLIPFAIAATLATTSAQAAVFTGATTLTSPTFNRPLANANSAPTSLSGTGTAVHYQVVPFTVSATGSYSFVMAALVPANWDTYLGLYANSFSPTAPLANAVIYNDDFPTIGLSGFSTNLTAGTSYFALATGFGNTNVGTYTLTVTGPGAVALPGVAGAVPEPASWAMLLAGFGVLGTAMRRRTARVSFAI